MGILSKGAPGKRVMGWNITQIEEEIQKGRLTRADVSFLSDTQEIYAYGKTWGGKSPDKATLDGFPSEGVEPTLVDAYFVLNNKLLFPLSTDDLNYLNTYVHKVSIIWYNKYVFFIFLETTQIWVCNLVSNTLTKSTMESGDYGSVIKSLNYTLGPNGCNLIIYSGTLAAGGGGNPSTPASKMIRINVRISDNDNLETYSIEYPETRDTGYSSVEAVDKTGKHNLYAGMNFEDNNLVPIGDTKGNIQVFGFNLDQNTGNWNVTKLVTLPNPTSISGLTPLVNLTCLSYIHTDLDISKIIGNFCIYNLLYNGSGSLYIYKYTATYNRDDKLLNFDPIAIKVHEDPGFGGTPLYIREISGGLLEVFYLSYPEGLTYVMYIDPISGLNVSKNQITVSDIGGPTMLQTLVSSKLSSIYNHKGYVLTPTTETLLVTYPMDGATNRGLINNNHVYKQLYAPPAILPEDTIIGGFTKANIGLQLLYNEMVQVKSDISGVDDALTQLEIVSQ